MAVYFTSYYLIKGYPQLMGLILPNCPEDLAMNAADNYRKIQEERYILERTIPLTDYGKGCKILTEIKGF
jgi:hypothetical protein